MTTKKICLWPCAAVAVYALVISCATPPKPTASSAVGEPAKPAAPTIAAPATPTTPAVAAPDDLRSQASALRKKAFDLGLKDVLPDDYSAAEASFSAGTNAYGVDNTASGASFKDAASKFSELIKKGLPILVTNAKGQATKLRDTAVSKKAGELFSDLLAYADADFAKASASESSDDYETALAGYKASATEFEALYKLCDASSARGFLVSHDLTKWDPSNWSLAESKFSSAQSLYKQDSHASVDAVDEANLRYGVARNTAYEYYASDRKKASETERDRAESIKSSVAVKDEYEAAIALYTKAEADESVKNYEASSSEYDSAAKAFAEAYTHAKAKMDTAKDEIDSLDSALSSAEAAAAQTN
jgi:hypothetical protein